MSVASSAQLCESCTGPLTCPTCASLDVIEDLLRRIMARVELERGEHG